MTRLVSRTARCVGPIVAVLSLLAPPGALAGEGPPLVTDRPDVTESSEVVPRGTVQIEVGSSFVRADADGDEVETSTLPGTLVRVGLDSRVELRFEWIGWVSESREAEVVRAEETGSGDTALGIKVKLREERGAAPQLALLADARLPTGSRSFRGERIDPALRLAASHGLSERLGLGYNVGIAATTIEDGADDLDTNGLGRYSVALGLALTERWGSFVELSGFLPFGGGPAHSFGAGITFLSSKTVQLDVSGSVGLNDRAEDWSVGAGLSFRLPR